MKLRVILKSIIFLSMVISIPPLVITSSVNDYQYPVMSTNEDFPKVHKVLIYKKENLGNIISFDTYHMKLKESKEYYFYTKINIPSGLFSLAVTGPGGSDLETGTWDSSTPANERKITFLFTPSATGNYTITVSTLAASDGGSYTLYVNRYGFAGWWWMLFSGIGILLIPIIIIVTIKSSKKKKRKRKRK